MKRREFVAALSALLAVPAVAGPEDPIRIEKVVLSRDEWRKRLSPEAY